MDKALLARVERQAWFHRYPRGFPVSLLILSLAITIFAVFAVEQSGRANRRLQVDARASELAAAIQRRATETTDYLVAGASVFALQGQTTPELFSMYLKDMSNSLRSRVVLGIGWTQWVRRADLASFEAAQRKFWPSGRTVYPRPVESGQMLAPVTLIEPLDPPNRAALGFDMYSEAERRATMDRVRRSGRPTMTGPVHLIQDEQLAGQVGFLIYVPVLTRQGNDRPELIGFVYGAFRSGEFLQSAASLVDVQNLDFALYDTSVRPENLLVGKAMPTPARLSSVVSLTVAQRELKLVVVDREPPTLSGLAQLVALFGTIIGALIMGAALLVTHLAMEDRRVLEWQTNQAKIRNALSRELNHRVKNTLANVLSIVSLTRRRSTSVDEFAEGLIGRLRALSATQDLLVQREWMDAPVRDIVRSELAPYMQSADSHVRLDGPDVAVAPNDALSLGLALHELATNAAKYGALSAPGGQVAVDWAINSAHQVELIWQESGGPAVAVPTKRGFGSDLIERIVAHELQQEISLEFNPAGVRCKLVVPLRNRSAFAIRQPG